MNRADLIAALKAYTPASDLEKNYAIQFLELLQHPDAYQRTHLPGHITGSAWIVDAARENVLLVHHGTLNRWLQPGGHADGDEEVLRVALREAEEETGVKNYTVLPPALFDIDIHPIPERKGFPEHLHYDVRFLMEADIREPLVLSEESHDVAWKPLASLGALTQNNPSVMRMVEKVKSLPRQA